MARFEDFTGIYKLSKTLRFALIPIGKTLENFISSGILEQDQHRAESYQKVKKLIDEYHKVFIDRVLSSCRLRYDDRGKQDSLSEYFMYYNMKRSDETSKKKFEEVIKSLRKQISDCLKKDGKYNRMFKKELITEDLPNFLDNPEDTSLVNEFREFTTYFKGFHENRENMYSAEEQSTAISFRLINENLPRFVDNMNVFAHLMTVAEMQECVKTVYSDFESYLNVNSIEEMFQLDYFNDVLTQRQIDVYNAIIGGRSEGDEKIQGINEYINLYNQQHKEKRLPFMKILYKQILSDRVAISWLPDVFISDNDALKSINEFYDQLRLSVLDNQKLKSLLSSLGDYNLDRIFIRNDQQLTDLSQKAYGHWSIIQDAIMEYLVQTVPMKKRESSEKYEERLNNIRKNASSYSIKYIQDCVSKMKDEDESQKLVAYFMRCGGSVGAAQCDDLFSRIDEAYEDAKALLSQEYPEDRNLSQDKDSVSKLKNLLDAIKDLQWFVKLLLGKGDEADKDERFYGELTAYWDQLDEITPLYNKVRNYMTRKPYSQDKLKLNFENSTLMDGWDQNKEPDNTTVILRKNGIYYIAIMNKKHKRVFTDKKIKTEGECYEKMVYKYLPGANKMFPKVFFSKSRIGEFNPSKQLLKKYKEGTYKKGEKFNINDCRALIDFYKQSISKHEDWRKFGFNFSDTSSYEDISGFYREVDHQGYALSFMPVSVAYIDKLVDEGKLYLFQIYSKDFSPYSKGTPNMHTLYWKMLFDEKNLADVVYKLSGGAEVFFRKKSLNPSRPTHPANVPIPNKNNQNKKHESVFNYDLQKDRRYTVDKFLLHVPIELNFKGEGNDNINQQVNEYLAKADDTHIIGIDRGERHLLYLVVIDRKGNIVEQFSLNEIVNDYGGQTYKTDYHELLDKREKERLEARQSWKSIETIKELKEGYLSQVIHKITQLMIKYHAIVVLEDLNLGFMRGRQKVEKQVYQKFEKMLIDKLNYLVDKNLPADSEGGLLKAYQLANKFESFQKLGKQSGFLFYVPAWNTSKIDPVTGFVNMLDTSCETPEKTIAFINKFDAIRYNEQEDCFEFDLDYDKFGTKAEGTRTRWTLSTHGTRIKTSRNREKNSSWDSVELDLTAEFKSLLSTKDIDITAHDLRQAICSVTEKPFHKVLIRLIRLMLQMRNSMTGTEIDYLISPVKDDSGHFFDSRNSAFDLPKNADANGAYNIARKGLMLLRQLKEAANPDRPKFDVSNKEWLRFAQQKPYLND